MSRRVTGFAKAFLSACVLVVAACGDNATTGNGGAGGAAGLEGDGSAANGGGSGTAGSSGAGGSGSTVRADGGGSGGVGGTDGKDSGGSGGASGSGGESGKDGGGSGGAGGAGEGGTSGTSGGSGGTGADDKCKKNSDCSDGKFCNGNETCDPDAAGADAKGCLDGKAPDCRDEARCTVDACDEGANKCTHTKNDARCDNGDYCDGTETCDPDDADANGNGCVADPVDPCDDGLDCTADGCNEGTNVCLHVPVHSKCADMNDGGNADYCNIETCEPANVLHDADGCVSVGRNCADTVDCTDDSCNEATDTCDHDPDDGFCDDGLCDGRDTCDAVLGCQEAALVMGIPAECADDLDCTVDGCSGGACTHTPDDSACGNGLDCDGVELCQPGAGADEGGCVTGPPPVCSDGYDCTVDTCVDTMPGHVCNFEEDDNFCRDEFFCNGQETCAPGAIGSDPDTGCQDGPLCPTCADPTENPPNCTVELAVPCECEDDSPCTVDDCDADFDTGGGAKGKCDNVPNDNFCNVADGFKKCNGDETCVPQLSIADTNGCIAGAPFVCNDGFSCTIDSCEPGPDDCVATPIDLRCTDLGFCNGNQVDGAERCDPDSVSPVPNPITGCVSDPSTNCSAADCSATFCDVPCVGMSCDDAVSCTSEVCSEATDSCVQAFNHGDCMMGEICADTGCEPGQACVGDGDCDNSNRCFPETCTGGICVPAPRDCDDSIVCTRDFCTTDTMDPRADGNGCVNDVNDILGNNTACDDGNRCNGDETCDPAFGCGVIPTPLDCDDGVDCTDDACDPDTGCSNTPVDGNCPDAFCNDQYCDFTLDCQPLPARDCDDSIPCTTDSCDEANDECDHTPVHTACANPNFCDGVEQCVVGIGCAPGTPVLCNDGISCSDDSCDEAGDQCQFVFNSGNCPMMQICTGAGCQAGATCTPPTAACDDGLFCNGGESCSSMTNGVPGVCQAGTLPNCDDMDPCTVDACSDILGQCTHTPRDQDNDGFGDNTCGGSDCNDMNAAINPLAVDICDGIDNNCDNVVDNGLVLNGGACTSGSQCCSNTCQGGLCTFPSCPDPPPAQCCRQILDTCANDFECCTGSCDTYVDGQQHCLAAGSCALSGTACVTAADCCSLACVGGVCNADPANVCKEQGATGCTSDAQCCSNNCDGGTCAAPTGLNCGVSGETCSSDGNCCSGFCYHFGLTGKCAPHDTCRAEGEICTLDTQCCTGKPQPGSDPADLRGCDDVHGQCVALGSCASTGQPCSGVRSCCSNLCVDAGWGTEICQFLSGCRPFGEVCTEDFQCCAGTVNTNVPPICLPPDPSVDNVRRCENPPGCVDPGEMCAAGGSGASNNCCVAKSRGCTPTGLGVSRCNDCDLSDPACCLDVGEECEFSEQCCNGKPCIPDMNGIPRCASNCASEGALCTAHGDCCLGLMCYESVCVTNTLGCTPIGQTCTADTECCSDVCLGGICNQPP